SRYERYALGTHCNLRVSVRTGGYCRLYSGNCTAWRTTWRVFSRDRVPGHAFLVRHVGGSNTEVTVCSSWHARWSRRRAHLYGFDSSATGTDDVRRCSRLEIIGRQCWRLRQSKAKRAGNRSDRGLVWHVRIILNLKSPLLTAKQAVQLFQMSGASTGFFQRY